ncbi:Fimbrial protein domain-containing protein [Serratia sp. AS12]|uniref:type 1 fimbrial major subunit FimA n=1 Tax=Serratia TaxID=613 RepID=UPI00020E92B2|nr:MULTISPECIES: type 1 fimbrial major subunit FimA [Serratia]AEF44254.1 Fimbrial protein domain-containing protein [Serratia plymuthica AS9]AEF49206.1 Fimbrial protein domain-containing protein [Serratia sp. AS12]AEG26913.1 Fimbrial protein domain-containing protein [Serratia sp. AS13]UTN97782.1 type 1 fimbrial major subunit FimA [Serratia plymuthica]
MNFKLIPLAGLISALTLGAAMNASAATVNGGTVHFKGDVVNAACAVNTNSFDQTVHLGQVRTAKLAKDGDKSTPVGFNIELNDCDTTVSSTASILFDGVSVSGKPTVLALQSSAAGSATNVGVQILDSTGTPVMVDGSAASTAYTLSDGTNKIPFQAAYYATGQATAGAANADAAFKVEYQ